MSETIGVAVVAVWFFAALGWIVAFPAAAAEHVRLIAANAANVVTFGWYRRLEERSGCPAPTLCTHWQAVACHESVTGDIVAWLCPDCDKQLAERPPLAQPPR